MNWPKRFREDVKYYFALFEEKFDIMALAKPSYNAALTSKFFRDTPNSGGGVPRSASSYSVQAPDMEDVKESVRQVWH